MAQKYRWWCPAHRPVYPRRRRPPPISTASKLSLFAQPTYPTHPPLRQEPPHGIVLEHSRPVAHLKPQRHVPEKPPLQKRPEQRERRNCPPESTALQSWSAPFSHVPVLRRPSPKQFNKPRKPDQFLSSSVLFENDFFNLLLWIELN